MSYMQANLTSSDGLVAKAGLGDEFTSNGATYKYLKSTAAINQYDAVVVTNANLATRATTGLSGAKPTLFAIPQFAVAAADEFFWAPIGPFTLKPDGTAFQVNALALCATSVKLYTTGTDGSVDDTATDLIAGLCLTETLVGAGSADCIAVQRLVSNCQD